MTQSQLISILTSTYNQEKYIDKLYQSILVQNYTNFELVIVDDCSTDNTVNIIKKFNDRRVKLYINDKNLGESKSINHAINNLNKSSSFFTIVSSDDELCPNYLEELMIITKREKKYDCFYTNFYTIDKDGNELSKISSENFNRKKFILEFKNYIGMAPLFRNKKVIIENFFFDEKLKYSADYLLHIRLSRIINYKYVNIHLGRYRIHSRQKTTEIHKFYDYEKLTKIVISEENYSNKISKDYLSNLFARCLVISAKEKNFKFFFKFVLKYLYLNKFSNIFKLFRFLIFSIFLIIIGFKKDKLKILFNKTLLVKF